MDSSMSNHLLQLVLETFPYVAFISSMLLQSINPEDLLDDLSDAVRMTE